MFPRDATTAPTARERVTWLGFAFAVGEMSGVSGSGVLGTCTALLLVYMSLFLAPTHEFLALFSLFLEVVPGVDSYHDSYGFDPRVRGFESQRFGGPRFPRRGSRPQRASCFTCTCFHFFRADDPVLDSQEVFD